MDKICKLNLPDVQCTEPAIKIPIHQVGVENVEVPFMLESKFGGFQDMVAKVSMRTNLDDNNRGISMSRLLLTLQPYLRKPLKHFLINEILVSLKDNIGSTSSFIKFEFKLPVLRKSPVSDNEFPIYYNCKFEGQLNNGEFRFFQGIRVQYSSYCPCSAELCEDLGGKGSSGYPHAQRSFAELLIETIEPNYVWLEDIIETVEKAVHTLPYPVIKRVDEQEIARIAADNPMFVEDAIRAISHELNKRDDIYDWIVKCTHEESIHTSEAIAMNYKGVENGFDGKYFL